MKKKLIALDIDGTLINGGSPLSERAIEVLSRLVREGHEVVFASGRPVRAIMPYYLSIHCSSPIIAYNGLWSHRPQALGKKPGYVFKKDIVQEIYDKCKDRISSFMAESETVIYSSKHDDYLDMFFPYEGMKEIISPNVELKEDVLTVLFCPKTEEDNKYIEELVESYDGYGYRRWTNSPYAEMYRKGITKGFGLELIQKALKIGKDDTIAIGDSDNDFEMLQKAKYAYAIKGCKSKKLLSAFLTTEKGLNEDGAIATLEKLLLK